MKDHFQITKNFLVELNFNITYENAEDEVIVVQKENFGIKNLILGVSPPILIMEQFIFNISNQSEKVFKNLKKSKKTEQNKKSFGASKV